MCLTDTLGIVNMLCSSTHYCMQALCPLCNASMVCKFHINNGNINSDPAYNPTGELIRLVDGKELFILNGYSYYRRWAVRSNWRWSCTNSRNCRAYIHLDCEMNVVFISEHAHQHPARALRMNHMGLYFRL